MTNDEFEFNKELLKEIASKKKELRITVNSQQMANASATQFPKGTTGLYEVYNL